MPSKPRTVSPLVAGPDEAKLLTPGQIAAAKAIKTWRMANTLAKALAKRHASRWQFLDFLGPKGRESAGIVDIIAMRKSGKVPDARSLKRYDLFDIILIQVKGGGAAWPSGSDIERLLAVRSLYGAHKVVLYQWVHQRSSGWFEWDDACGDWTETSAKALFGH